MKDFYYFTGVKEMPLQILQQWLDKAYEWHDEAYIALFKQEFKRRGVKPIYE